MLGALNTILKKIIGDKKEKDLEAIQPILKATKTAYDSIANATADDVRRMSKDMQVRIQKHIQHLETEVEALNAKADALP
ncbi:MAG: hypothetical protein ACKO7C_07565, partial [Bacteroidota bacterium]